LSSKFENKDGDDSDDMASKKRIVGDKQLSKSKIQQKLRKYQEMIKFQRYVNEKIPERAKKKSAHVTKIQLYINNPVFMINQGSKMNSDENSDRSKS